MKLSIRYCLGLLALLTIPAMLGAGTFVATNSDLMSIRGPGEFQVVKGTVIHQHYDNGEWFGLFSRNKNSQDIELSVEEGTYYVETWSIAPNPMSPQRVHKGMEVTIGDGGGNPSPGYGVNDMLALLAAWGPCAAECPYDFNGDGNVGTADLLHLLANWGG